jgi:hypothetical protein
MCELGCTLYAVFSVCAILHIWCLPPFLYRTVYNTISFHHILSFVSADGGAELDEHTELGKFIVQSFPLHMYARLIHIRHSWVTFWKEEKVRYDVI